MNDRFDEDMLVPVTETEAAEERHRELRAAHAADRRRRLAAAAPWLAAVAFAAAAVVIGLSAWAGTVTRVPAAGNASAPTVAVERAIPSRDTTRSQPTGVAVSGDRLYIADPRRAVVDVLTREGSRVATFGAGYLETPVYVAVGPVDGRVYVSDRGRQAVVIFAADGSRFGMLTPAGVRAQVPAGVSWRPLALGFAPDGTLYVADSAGEQSIAVFSPAGSRVGTIGADVPVGRSGRRLAFPNAIAATSDRIVVADSNNGRLLVFTRDGRFLRQIDVDGLPRGLAVLADGRMLVTDAATNMVTVYTPAGQARVALGGPDDPGVRFASPAGAAVDADGRVYVGDAGTGAVQVLRTSAAGAAVVAGASGNGDRWLQAIAIACAALAAGLAVLATARARMRARG